MDSGRAVRTVSRNLVINVFGAFWQLVLVIVGTRLVLDRMGAESFGILALVGGVSGYFIYLDIGIGETVVKKVSEAQSPERLGKIVSTIFFLSAGVGMLLAAVVLFFALFGVDALFSFAPELMQSTARMFLVIAAGLWILYPLNTFSKVFAGLHRFDIYNILRIVFQTLILAGIILVLDYHNTAEAAVAVITLIGMTWKGTAWLILRRLYPGIHVRPSNFDRETLKDVMRYKSYAFVAQTAGHTINQCDIFVVGILLNPAAIALYTIANTVAIKVSEVGGVLGTVLFPMLSSCYGANQMERIRKMHLLGTHALMLILMPLAAFIIVYAREIVGIWVGEEYGSSAVLMQGLAVAWFFNIISTVSSLSTKAINRPEIDMWWIASVAVTNVVLDFIMVSLYGLAGAVYATMLCNCLGIWILMARVGRALGIDVPGFFLSIVKILVAGTLSGVVFYLPLPAALFFLKPLLYMAVLYPAYYFLIAGDNRPHLKNMMLSLLGRAAV